MVTAKRQNGHGAISPKSIRSTWKTIEVHGEAHVKVENALAMFFISILVKENWPPLLKCSDELSLQWELIKVKKCPIPTLSWPILHRGKVF